MSFQVEGTRWSADVQPVWSVTTSIAKLVAQLELVEPALLPDLHIGDTLLLACDYGGQHRSAAYETFSFLLTDLAFCWLWDENGRVIRNTILKDKRRMSCKGLNDSRKRSALLPFLRVADSLPGVLVTVLVEKKYSATMAIEEADHDQLPLAVQSWPASTIRKFVWAMHLGALFVAGLSRPFQNLWWITDQDAIAANDGRLIGATPIVAGILTQYCSRDMGHLRFGTTACDNGDLFLEDIAAITDFAAGALSEIPVLATTKQISSIAVPLGGHVPSKALQILNWIGTPKPQPLRRLVFVVDQGDTKNKVRVRGLVPQVRPSAG